MLFRIGSRLNVLPYSQFSFSRLQRTNIPISEGKITNGGTGICSKTSKFSPYDSRQNHSQCNDIPDENEVPFNRYCQS